MPDTNNFEPNHTDITRHLQSGAISTALTQGIRLVCSFASVIVLARLLRPSEFGIAAMVWPVTAFVGLFQDLGLGQATVQKPSLTHDEINTFFWITVGLGAALTLLLVLLSPLVGLYYNNPHVVPLTCAMSTLIFLNSCASQHNSLLSRRMAFLATGLIDALGTVISLLVALFTALVLHNYWAIFYSSLTGSLIYVIGAWIAAGWRPTFPVKFASIRHALHFGANITGFNLLTFFARNLDNVLIGHRWGDHELGLYDRAYKLLLFPLQRIAWPIGNVMVPLLSRLVDDEIKYRNLFLDVLAQMTLATWPGIIWGFIFSDRLLTLLLGHDWTQAASIFKPLAIAALAQIPSTTSGWLFLSQGRGTAYGQWGLVLATTSIIGFVIGLPHGAIGVAIAYAAGETIRLPFGWWKATREGPVDLKSVIICLIPQLAGCAVASLALTISAQFLAALPAALILGLEALLAYATMIATLGLFPAGRRSLCQSLAFARKLLTHRKLGPA